MVITYVGRKTDLCGKTLWEIVGNLKGCGVGRLVTRQIYAKYPEPSFFRIVKVEADPQPPPEAPPDSYRKVRVWAEKVFRGRQYPQLVEVYRVSYKPDYRLVPKCEEKQLWEKVMSMEPQVKVLPRTVEFPPLLKYLIKEEMRKNGEEGEPVLKLKVKKGRENFYRLAQSDSEPVQFSVPTLQPQLYEVSSDQK